ncbi:MAG: type 4a pilus biogenesis protein PilO [Tepidisphaeraceae bacterium]|jgi:Tfp pilus assembly protein PilO
MTEQIQPTNRLTRQILTFAKVQYALSGGMLAALVLFYFGVYRPQQAQIDSLDRQTAAKKTELDNDLSQTGKLPKVELELRNLKARLAGFKKLPVDAQIGQFDRDVNDAVQRAGLQKLVELPGAARRDELYFEEPIVLTFQGEFTSVYSFIRALEDMDRLTRVREVTMNGINSKTGTVNVSLEVNIYYSGGR